ncbi:hypothetical protein D3C85_1116930 [compost metagenome]
MIRYEIPSTNTSTVLRSKSYTKSILYNVPVVVAMLLVVFASLSGSTSTNLLVFEVSMTYGAANTVVPACDADVKPSFMFELSAGFVGPQIPEKLRLSRCLRSPVNCQYVRVVTELPSMSELI